MLAHRHRRSKRYAKNRLNYVYGLEYARVMATAPRISVEELKDLIDRGADTLIIDVRESRDWRQSDIKIAGARRVPPAKVHNLVDTEPHERTIVAY